MARRFRQNRIAGVLFAAVFTILGVVIFPLIPAAVVLVAFSAAGMALWMGWLDWLSDRPRLLGITLVVPATGFVIATAWRFATAGFAEIVSILVVGESLVLLGSYRAFRAFQSLEARKSSVRPFHQSKVAK